MTVTPCKGCTERKVECHSTCEKYHEWKKIFEKEKEQITKSNGYRYKYKNNY